MDESSSSAAGSAVAAMEDVGEVGELVRALNIQGAQLAWLVGAGASAMSDIPTARALILRFKHELYCSANNLYIQEVDPADGRTRRLIEEYFDGRNGLPQLGDPDEYSVAFEAAYPSAGVRADLIASLCRGRRPNYGHYLMAALMAAGKLNVVFTTNFDDLIEIGANTLFESAGVDPRPSVVVGDLGEPDKAARALQRSSWPLVGKLHGDFRSVQLKNTVGELAHQDEAMRRVLRTACGRFGFVVVGYSGRDYSVMNVLIDALTDPGSFPAGIYWCHRTNEPPAEGVMDFVATARASGRQAQTIAVDNFVELAGRIERGVLLPQNVHDDLGQRRPPQILTPAQLPTGSMRRYPILRLNALPIVKMPRSVRHLSEPSPCELRDLQQALRSVRVRGLVARRSGGQLVAVGDEDQIANALEPTGITVANDVDDVDWDQSALDPADLGLAIDALTIGLGRTEGLRHVLSRRGHQVRVGDPKIASLERLRSACGSLGGVVPKTALPWAEAVALSIERRNGSWWLLVIPEIWISPSPTAPTLENRERRRADQAAAAEFTRKRRALRYNKNVNAILDAWVRLLCGGRGPREVRTWNLGSSEGIDPTFEIGGLTAFSRPLDNGSRENTV
jgi:hypothetical protein